MWLEVYFIFFKSFCHLVKSSLKRHKVIVNFLFELWDLIGLIIFYFNHIIIMLLYKSSEVVNMVLERITDFLNLINLVLHSIHSCVKVNVFPKKFWKLKLILSVHVKYFLIYFINPICSVSSLVQHKLKLI